MPESSRRWAVLRGKRRFLLGAMLCLALMGGAGFWLFRVEGLIQKAEQALADRDYVRAGQLVDEYLGVWSSSGKGHFLAARIARLARGEDTFARHLRRCRDLGWDAEAIAVESRLADMQRGEGQAEAYLRALADAGSPHAPWILEVLIQFYLNGYRLDQALQCLNRYLEVRPDDLQALLGRAFVWERFLYFGDALEDYRRAVELHPESDRARLKLAQTSLISGTPQEALEHFLLLAERHGDQTEVRLGLAQCRRRLGESLEAGRLLDALLAESPDHADALWERAQLAFDSGKPEEAEPLLLRAERQAPNDRKIAHALARCAAALGRKEEAECYEARADRIRADLEKLGRLSKEVIRFPRDAALRYEMGLLFLRTGEEPEGVRWLELALRLDPRHQQAREAIVDYVRRDAQRRSAKKNSLPGHSP